MGRCKNCKEGKTQKGSSRALSQKVGGRKACKTERRVQANERGERCSIRGWKREGHTSEHRPDPYAHAKGVGVRLEGQRRDGCYLGPTEKASIGKLPEKAAGSNAHARKA